MAGLPLRSYSDRLNSLFDKYAPKFASTCRDQYQPLTRLTFGRDTAPFTGKKVKRAVRLLPGADGQVVDLYEGSAATLVNMSGEWAIEPVYYVNKSMVYDEKEDDLAGGSEVAWSLMDMKSEGTSEAVNNNVEDMLVGVPTSASNDLRRFLGPRYWFPEIEASVTDYVGGFNGDILTRQDGSTTTTIGQVDRSLAQNARLRTWQGTYDEVGPALIRMLRRAADAINFMSLSSDAKGEKPTGPAAVLIMGTSVAHEFEDLVNKGPDDLMGQLARFRDPTVRGMRIEKSTAYDQLANAPITGLVLSKWKGYVCGGKWNKPGRAVLKDNCHDVWIKPIDCHGNCMPTNLQSGGFSIALPR